VRDGFAGIRKQLAGVQQQGDEVLEAIASARANQ